VPIDRLVALMERFVLGDAAAEWTCLMIQPLVPLAVLAVLVAATLRVILKLACVVVPLRGLCNALWCLAEHPMIAPVQSGDGIVGEEEDLFGLQCSRPDADFINQADEGIPTIRQIANVEG
jgi:hypothetical protein